MTELVPGTAGTDDWCELTTVGDAVFRAATRWPGRDALVFPERRVSYSQVLAGAQFAAHGLLGVGLEPGDRVGILMNSCGEFVDLFYACALIGAVAVPMNGRFKSSELGYIAADSEVAAIVTRREPSGHVDYPALLSDAFREARPANLRHLVCLNSEAPPDGFIGQADFEALSNADTSDVHAMRRSVRLRETALILYTSGTTASPKGCLLTHEALMRTSKNAAERWCVTSQERFWDPLPLYHIAAIFPMLANVLVGGCFITTPHFDAAEAIEIMAQERCTFAYPVFPTISQAIVHHPDFTTYDLSCVQAVADTGPEDALIATEELWPSARVLTLYGATEAGGIVTFSDRREARELRVRGGHPFPGNTIRIIDPESGQDLKPGEEGEILVSGPTLFEGYVGDPVATSAALRGKWLHTGDRGCLDADGRLTYLGRFKDMLKIGGENVAAIEIEAYLLRHPAVQVAVVIGIPDSKYTEVPAAFLELIDGTTVTEQEIINFCADKIARFKVPRYVRIVDEWPMSASKIQRFKLRKSLLSELGIGT